MTEKTEAEGWMRRALHLATQGYTPPNPMVGCVIVKDGESVGEGYHPYAGQPHAEAFALRAAGDHARGATVYVTLEPCCHWGRTPPCTDALIAAGVARVIVATRDIKDEKRGRGVEILRAAGIEVEIGLLEAEARALNAAFFHYHETGLPLVTLKAAMTLDGKIASHTGESKWITGEESRRQVHELRARSGAVMVGINTLLADDAKLDARLPGVELPRQPLRVVVDSRLRTPPTAAAVQLARRFPAERPLLIAATEAADRDRMAALTGDGVEVLLLPGDAGNRVELRALMRELGARQIISVLCEGGGELNAGLLRAGMAHRALFFIAPKLLGGRNAPTPLEGEGADSPTAALPLADMEVVPYGPDFALMGKILNKELAHVQR
jgi:diaminohydroxyphosphoribosylaminopyrimidine deaminase/5-amino-6-(5-phosphoribosylamino)uracil reductase